MTDKTFRCTFGYNGLVRIRRQSRTPRQDLRDVPTYSIPEAAAFLAIPRRTLNEWFSGEERIFKPSGDYEKCSLLSFKDITEAYIIYLLRQFHHFSLDHIRRSLANLRKETNSQHPIFIADLKIFARSLLFDKATRGDRGRVVVDLSHDRQLAIPEITDVFSKRILHDPRGQPFLIYPWREFKTDHISQPVSIDPEVLSGRLVVTGTRIPVSALVGMKIRRRTPQEIANNYGLDVETVEKALRHVEKPLPKVA